MPHHEDSTLKNILTQTSDFTNLEGPDEAHESNGFLTFSDNQVKTASFANSSKDTPNRKKSGKNLTWS